MLGAIAQFDKATTVAKLKAARDRKRDATRECEGRESYAERDPELVALAREIKNRGGRVSLRQVSGELSSRGHVTLSGKAYSASAVAAMLG